MTQEKKNIFLAGSLLALLLFVIALFLNAGKNEEVDKEVFKVQQLDEIDRVQLSSKGRDVNLSFNGSRWMVNEAYQADDQLITVLFATLQQAVPKRLIASSIRDSVSNAIRTQGIHISLFKEEEKLKNFYVGGDEASRLTYFMDDDNGPYIMNIPGYRVYVAGIFEVDENGWRDKRIFNFNWRNFKSLKTEILSQPNQGFEIKDVGTGFDLVNSPTSDTTKLNNYLDAVSLLVAKQFVLRGSDHRYDSLLQTQPYVTIEVFDLGDNVYKLGLYRPLDGDTNVLGQMGSEDAVLFDNEQVLPILKSKDYFVRR